MIQLIAQPGGNDANVPVVVLQLVRPPALGATWGDWIVTVLSVLLLSVTVVAIYFCQYFDHSVQWMLWSAILTVISGIWGNLASRRVSAVLRQIADWLVAQWRKYSRMLSSAAVTVLGTDKLVLPAGLKQPGDPAEQPLREAAEVVPPPAAPRSCRRREARRRPFERARPAVFFHSPTTATTGRNDR